MRLIKGILAIVLCFGMVGCSTKDHNEQEIVVVDQAGRTLTFDKPAERVVSGYYIATSTLIGLGQKEKLVGVEMKADKRKIYQMAAPEILELPAMGNKKSFNVEECAKAKPDVVFLPISLKSYVEQLDKLGIKVILLNPESKLGFEEAVRLMAKVCGADEKAQEYIDYRDRLQVTYQASAKKQNVYFAGSDLLQASGPKMFQGEMMKQVNAENVISDTNQTSWITIGKETLLQANPDVIFVEQGGAGINAFLQEEALQSINAVKNRQVYEFPSKLETWDTPNLSYCLGELWMKATLGAEGVSMDDVIKEAQKFYQQFYGIEVTAQDLGL